MSLGIDDKDGQRKIGGSGGVRRHFQGDKAGRDSGGIDYGYHDLGQGIPGGVERVNNCCGYVSPCVKIRNASGNGDLPTSLIDQCRGWRILKLGNCRGMNLYPASPPATATWQNGNREEK